MARKSIQALDKRYARIQQNLVYLKTRSGKTTVEIAEYIGISAATFIKRMRNPKLFTLDNIDRIARLYNVDADKIITGQVCITEVTDGYAKTRAS